ncbi:MAG: hypothetical protein IIC73_01000, partial [Armatimonadetes bacterium]|nr:hypothetical protein [Armatimonadota bacterium]
MNETTFEQTLKLGMRPIAERPELDTKISARLRRATAAARTKRWGATLGAAAAAVVLMSVFLFPRAEAQPTFAQIAGALDDVKSVRIVRYSITEDGERVFAGRIDYQMGKWHMVMPGGGEETLWLDGDFYFFDKSAGNYVHSLRPDGPFNVNRRGLRLSVMLEPGGGLGDKEVALTDGKHKGTSVKIASIEDRNLGVRTVIQADANTLLPIIGQLYSLEQGEWRLRGEFTYDYSPKFPEGHFALKPGVPVVSDADSKSMLVDRLTADELVTIDIKGGRLVVRSVNVARDGTVFVTYQVGDKTRSWRGYRLT